MSMRNSPCPHCNSGLKYKKCCLPKERAKVLQKEQFIKLCNSPCPCKSGKKFRLCCMNKPAPIEPVMHSSTEAESNSTEADLAVQS